MKTTHLLAKKLPIIIAFLILTSCSDDDEVQPTVRIVDGMSSYDVLNDCNIGSGDLATDFNFDLDIETTGNIEIDGVEFDIEWSDGSESLNRFEDNFVVVGNSLLFDWCFRFDYTEWFDLKITLLAGNEEIESNQFTIRVEKPEDAN